MRTRGGHPLDDGQDRITSIKMGAQMRKRLIRLADERDTSVGHIVREFVSVGLEMADKEREMAAIAAE